MSEEKMVRIHATIHGRVQGVGFRAFVADQAARQNLTGWVRNRYNGTVETIAEGTQAAVDTFLKQLRRGPGPSNVTQVDHQILPATGEFSSFRIKMTG